MSSGRKRLEKETYSNARQQRARPDVTSSRDVTGHCDITGDTHTHTKRDEIHGRTARNTQKVSTLGCRAAAGKQQETMFSILLV